MDNRHFNYWTSDKPEIKKQMPYFEIVFNKLKEKGLSADDIKNKLKNVFVWSGCEKYWDYYINNLNLWR